MNENVVECGISNIFLWYLQVYCFSS